MGDGSRLAFGILIVTLALAAFYFAFHHGGVANPDGSAVSNPSEAIQWLVSEFETATSGGNSSSTSASSASPATPGTTTGSSNIGQIVQSVTNPFPPLPTPTGQPSINSQLTGQ